MARRARSATRCVTRVSSTDLTASAIRKESVRLPTASELFGDRIRARRLPRFFLSCFLFEAGKAQNLDQHRGHQAEDQKSVGRRHARQEPPFIRQKHISEAERGENDEREVDRSLEGDEDTEGPEG